jgi:hypothetical protein
MLVVCIVILTNAMKTSEFITNGKNDCSPGLRGKPNYQKIK